MMRGLGQPRITAITIWALVAAVPGTFGGWGVQRFGADERHPWLTSTRGSTFYGGNNFLNAPRCYGNSNFCQKRRRSAA